MSKHNITKSYHFIKSTINVDVVKEKFNLVTRAAKTRIKYICYLDIENVENKNVTINEHLKTINLFCSIDSDRLTSIVRYANFIYTKKKMICTYSKKK